MHLQLLNTLLLAATASAHPHASADADAAKEAAPTLDEFLSSPMTFEKRQSNSSTPQPSATVQLCTAPNFAGECASVTWPVNTCIDLRGYAGVTQSFEVGDGFECLLMQGKCDATKPYVEIGDDEDEDDGSDLTGFEWIGEAKSYMCFTEIEALRRFVRIARLRIANGRVV